MPEAEKAHTARHQCGDCGRYVPEASVTAFRDDESGVMENKQTTDTDVKYRVTLIESDSWSGQSAWTEDFDTYEQAEQRVTSVNAANVSPIAPSCYVKAKKKIEAVRVVSSPPGGSA